MIIQVTIDQTVYAVDISDLDQRPVLARVDGETFEVWPEGSQPPTGQLEPAASEKTAAAVEHPPVVTAPRGGTITTISVSVGDVVTFGHPLCILETDGQKIAIRAAREGAIAALHVAEGDRVHPGQPLMDFSR